MRTTVAATLLAAVALTGCAALNNVESEVSSYSRWPSGRAPTTYSFERLPSQQDRPQQSQMLEDAARRAVEGAGFAAADEGAVPDVTVQVGARITETDRSPYDDPFWYRGYGPWYGGYGYRRYYRYGPSVWGPGWRGGYWGSAGYSPYYQREVAILIRDKRTGEPLYEGRAENEGPTTGVGRVLPAMFVAAMKDFPVGSTTNPHRVTVEPLP